jgi:hypothetical protein
MPSCSNAGPPPHIRSRLGSDLKWHSYEPEPDVSSVEEFASLISVDVELSAAVF